MKPNLPNQTYQTKHIKPNKQNLPNKTYQTKATKPKLQTSNRSKEEKIMRAWQVQACPELDTAQLQLVFEFFYLPSRKICGGPPPKLNAWVSNSNYLTYSVIYYTLDTWPDNYFTRWEGCRRPHWWYAWWAPRTGRYLHTVQGTEL